MSEHVGTATVESVGMEIHEKRHRGPKVLWRVGSFLAWNMHRLPHRASRVIDAVERAVFDTTITTISSPGNPPPPAGVREPRRPEPTGPVTSHALSELRTD
jgi:hypothetical protein